MDHFIIDNDSVRKVGKKSKYGNEILPVAIKKPKIDYIKKIRIRGVDINARDKFNRTRLYYAVEWGNEEGVEQLLSHGVDVNVRDVEGNTPLHVAARESTVTIIRRLLRHGADINVRNEENKTPLYYAFTGRNCEENIKELLAHGADVNLASNDGISILHLAMMRPTTFEILEQLLRLGADVNARDEYKQSPIFVAVEHRMKVFIKELLSHGADATFEDNKCNTPLHLTAIRKDTCVIIRDLLLHGADINARNKYNRTPLFNAVEWIDRENIKELLAHGADVNLSDIDGNTALHIAVEKCPIEIIMDLLDHGADFHCENKKGLSPLKILKSFTYKDCDTCINIHRRFIAYVLLQNNGQIEDITFRVKNQKDLQSLMESCCLEIDKMKKCKIHNKTSLFDICLINRINPNKLGRYIVNEAFSGCENKYPIYYHLLKRIIEYGTNRNKLLQTLEKLRMFTFPLEITSEYLSNKDLKRLINALDV